MSEVLPQPGYGAFAKLLHWLVFLLVIGQFALGWLMPDIGRDTRPEGLIAWHLAVGASILVLVAIRFAWRLYRPVPLVTDDVPPWQHRLAFATHWLLYAVLIAIVLLGWANAAARGYAVRAFGVVTLPPIASTGSPLGMAAGDLHGLLTWVLLGLVGLHVAAAFYHRLVLRDRVMARMLPGA
jgi:cytochrome b561